MVLTRGPHGEVVKFLSVGTPSKLAIDLVHRVDSSHDKPKSTVHGPVAAAKRRGRPLGVEQVLLVQSALAFLKDRLAEGTSPHVVKLVFRQAHVLAGVAVGRETAELPIRHNDLPLFGEKEEQGPGEDEQEAQRE